MRLRRFLINDPMARMTLLGFREVVPVREVFAVSVDLDHVQLAIPPGGEAAADEFYVGFLGLAVLDKPPALAARGGRWYATGTLQIHLGVDRDFRPARKAHPAFRVRDFDALRHAFLAADIDVRDDTEIEGVDRFYVDDPFGNRVELIRG